MDGMTFVTTKPCAKPDLDAMAAAVRAFKDSHPERPVEVFVMLEETLQNLKEQCEKPSPGPPGSIDALLGIRVEGYPTRGECIVRVHLLREEGVNAKFVSELGVQ